MSERCRRLILRAMVIGGAPIVFGLCWLTGPPDWRGEFRRLCRDMWKAERARDWRADGEKRS